MNTRIYILFLLLSFFATEILNAQNLKADSLENLLKKHKPDDTIKVNLLCEISNSISFNDVEKMRNFAQQALNLSEKLNFGKGKAESTWLIGLSYDKIDKLKSLDYFQKALTIAESNNNKAIIAKCCNSIGMNHRKRGDKEKAEEFLLKAIKISEELKDSVKTASYSIHLYSFYFVQGFREKAIEGVLKSIKILSRFNETTALAAGLNSLGAMYSEMNNYPLALEYYLKSLKINEKLNDKSAILTSLLNISYIYRVQLNFNEALNTLFKALKLAEELNQKLRVSQCLEGIGTVYFEQKKPQALEYYQRSLKIGEEIGDKYVIMNENECIGMVYNEQKKYKEALECYQKALAIAIKVNRTQSICDIMQKIAVVYFNLKDYNNALTYSQKSLDMAIEQKMLNNQMKLYFQLSQIDSATNNYKQAYIYFQNYKKISDSIFNEKKAQKLTELDMNYKFEKEKQSIENENQKKMVKLETEDKIQEIIIVSLVVCFLILLTFAIFLHRSNRFKQKTNSILTKQKKEILELNEEYQAVNEELKQSNEQLYATKKLVEESEEKLRLIIKNSNDIVVLVNENGEQYFISDVAENLTGYTVEELKGAIKDVIYPDDVKIVEHHWQRVLSDKNVADCIQYRHKHKFKDYVWFETVAQNFLDNPAINSVVANVRDITERKKIEQALKESEEEKAKLMELEMKRINNELEVNQKSITAATLKLIQNSERDAQTIERLTEIEKNTNPDGKQKINTLIADYKRKSYNTNWEEFEILFEKVHHSFYERLSSQFPNLTANERKMCAFFKLNMSSKDIAQITFQSEDALKKARLRLRQKLGLERETNLTGFIQQV